MEIKNKVLLNISWYIGLMAFIGGWTIFLTWAGARYWAALDFENLEMLGFFWMVGFFYLSLIALVLLFVYVLINRNNLHLKMLLTGLIILINIPSVFNVLSAQGDIENKVFVKLTNRSGLSLTELKLQGRSKTWNLVNLNIGSSMVFNYDPPFLKFDDRLYDKPDTLSLLIKHTTLIDTIGFPKLGIGACTHLILDENLTIKNP